MNKEVFAANEIPDPQCPRLQRRAGGDVRFAVGQAFERLLRVLAGNPPGAVCVTLRLAFTPLKDAGHVQARLVLGALVTSQNKALRRSVAAIIEQGPLSAFYPFRRGETCEVPWDRLKACHHIVRRERCLESLLKPEDNPMALPFYYVPDPLRPDETNGYMGVDHFLASCEEYLVVDIAGESVGVSGELRAGTACLERLSAINRSSYDDADQHIADPVFLGDDARQMSKPHVAGRPSRMRDPLAEDAYRLQKRLNENLALPHLRFNVRILAETAVTAGLVASTLASEAFEDGAYQVMSFSGQDACLLETIRCAQEGTIAAVPTRNGLAEGGCPRVYKGLSRLPQLATPDELKGVFRLPIAAYLPPQCIRRNTDPPLETAGDLIVVGHDQEVGHVLPNGKYRGVARGIELGNLTKHAFICGGTGTRKTSTVASFMPQFSYHGIPFLVIEPIKHDFRVLKILNDHPDPSTRELAGCLEVYTPGNDKLSPFRFNPMEIIQGVSRDERCESLTACFTAAIPLLGPLLFLLSDAVYEVYDAFEGSYRWPVMSDLLEAVECVMARTKYAAEVDSNIRAAFGTRLQSLCRGSIGKVFSSWTSVPSLKHMVETPTILELEGLSTEQACLLTHFVLTGVREYVKTR